jgi:hypothetical protein
MATGAGVGAPGKVESDALAAPLAIGFFVLPDFLLKLRS